MQAKIWVVLLIGAALWPTTRSAVADWRYQGEAPSSQVRPAPAGAMARASGAQVGQPSALPPQAPRNNMTMAMVRAAVGEPDDIMPAVGDPPITRWQYPGYVVYFDGDRVLVSVAGHW